MGWSQRWWCLSLGTNYRWIHRGVRVQPYNRSKWTPKEEPPQSLHIPRIVRRISKTFFTCNEACSNKGGLICNMVVTSMKCYWQIISCVCLRSTVTHTIHQIDFSFYGRVLKTWFNKDIFKKLQIEKINNLFVGWFVASSFFSFIFGIREGSVLNYGLFP